MEQTTKTPEEVLTENQKNYWKTVQSEDITFSPKLLTIWEDILPKMFLPKMISLQPLSNPVGLVFFYKYLFTKSEDGVTEVCLNIGDTTVTPKMFKLRHTLEQISPLALELDRFLLSIILDEIKKVGNVLHGVRSLEEEIGLGSQIVWRKCMRGPAKWLISNTKTLIDNKIVTKLPENETGFYSYGENEKLKLNIYSDDVFPEKEILMGYNGESILDAGAVWSPYQIYSLPNFVDGCCNNDRLRIRHEVSVVNPNFYQVITLD